jgi:hypothetical protein
MLTVREAMAAFLVNQGWSPEGAELMSWAVHPFAKECPPSTKALQKQIRRRADLVGQRGQGLEEQQAVQLAVNALGSYCQMAFDDGNAPLARYWADLLPGAPSAPAGSPPDAAPVEPTAAVSTAEPSGDTADPGGTWLHAVTLPPGRLAQLGSPDRELEPVGRFAAQVLGAHLVSERPDDDLLGLCERAALAGYLIDLDLAGVTPTELHEPTGDGLSLADVVSATEQLDATDLAGLARRHSPAADAVLGRLVAADSGGGVNEELVARCLGAGLCLARVQRCAR